MKMVASVHKSHFVFATAAPRQKLLKFLSKVRLIVLTVWVRKALKNFKIKILWRIFISVH